MPKLLIVDDEAKIRKGIASYIENNSKIFDKIYMAENGEAAIDIIFQYKPDVMLLDIQMPGKTGLEVLKVTKESGYCPKTIILSGYDEFEYARKALQYQVVDYLLKPCRPNEILEKLEAIVVQPGDKLSGENQIIAHVKEFIEENYTKNITLADAANHVKLSTSYLSGLFSQRVDCGFVDYVNKRRIENSCFYLKNGDLKTYEVAFKVGFHDEKYFTRVFKKYMGMTPSQFRNGISE